MMRLLKFLLFAASLGVIALGGLYVTAPTTFVRIAIDAERWASSLTRFEAKLPGFSVAYLDSGGTGEPLVLVHGFGGDKDNWTRVARHLRKHYRIIAPDLPGYGESTAPEGAHYRIDDQVEYLHAFVRKLGLSRVHLGGNSMGGNVAASYAAKHPNEVGTLWLIANSGITSKPPSELRRTLAEGGRNALIPSTREEYRELIAFVMSRPPFLPGAFVDVMADRAIAMHDLRVRQFAELSEDRFDFEKRIANMPIQTHVLWGEEDRALHVNSVNALMALLPYSSRTIMPGIGHVPMIEAPAETAEDYIKFRKGLRS
ncbi:MAG: alpha/beta fold hydrolase [Panacagrimonas sp.]